MVGRNGWQPSAQRRPPGWSGSARRVIDLLPAGGAERALHGDLRAVQIITTESAAVLVDFDHARRGDPLVDVGS
ncbi:MAG: phosphotransferase, partial [Chloroflexi bacterium]|nr:phosphotransferase [Chloroflexota bacterium]